MVQLLIRQGPTSAALVIGETDERPDLHEVSGELALKVVGAVKDRGLEMPEAFLAAGITPPNLTHIVLCKAPLTAGIRDGFLQRRLRPIPAKAVGIVGLVKVIVQGPDQAALLVLKVATLGTALEPELLGISHARSLGIAVDKDVLRIGLVNEDTVVERQDHARQDELIAVDHMLVEAAIALAALVT